MDGFIIHLTICIVFWRWFIYDTWSDAIDKFRENPIYWITNVIVVAITAILFALTLWKILEQHLWSGNGLDAFGVPKIP